MAPADQQRVRFTALYSGNVQGVGFRITAAQVARPFPVQGYVRNLPDGRVELVAEGVREQLDAFLAALQGEMGSYIRDTRKTESPGTGEFAGFSIRH